MLRLLGLNRINFLVKKSFIFLAPTWVGFCDF